MAITSILGRDKADRVRGAGIGAVTTRKGFNMKSNEVARLQEEFDQYKLEMQNKFQSLLEKVSTHIGMDVTNLMVFSYFFIFFGN